MRAQLLLLLLLLLLLPLCTTPTCTLGRPRTTAPKKDIRRLEVAVDDTVGVDERHPGGNLHGQRHGSARHAAWHVAIRPLRAVALAAFVAFATVCRRRRCYRHAATLPRTAAL